MEKIHGEKFSVECTPYKYFLPARKMTTWLIPISTTTLDTSDLETGGLEILMDTENSHVDLKYGESFNPFVADINDFVSGFGCKLTEYSNYLN